MADTCIGIAGYMGSGKTTSTRYLAEKEKISVVHADDEAKDIMLHNTVIQERLITEFGSRIIKNGILSFQILGSIVFENAEKLQLLSSIVHPVLFAHLHKTIFNNKSGIIILDGALLPFCFIDEWFDFRIWIEVSFATRLERQLNKQLTLEKTQIIARMRMQEQLFPKPSDRSWEYVPNDGDLDSCLTAIRLIIGMKRGNRL